MNQYPNPDRPYYQAPPAGYVSQYPVFPVLPAPDTPEQAEKKNVRKLSAGHGCAFLLQQALVTTVLLIVAVAVIVVMALSRGVNFSALSNLLVSANFAVIIYAALALLTIVQDTLPFLFLFKRQGIKLTELFVNENSRLKPALEFKNIFTMSVFTLGINFAGSFFGLGLKHSFSYLNKVFPRLLPFPEEGVNDDIFSTLYKNSNITAFLLSILAVAVLAPILEEVIFRGLIMKPLRAYGDGFAIICSSVLFGLAHGNYSQTPFAFVMGLFLGFVACQANSIIPTIILHAVNNFYAVTSGFLENSGHIPETARTIIYYIDLALLGVCLVYAIIRFARKKRWLILNNEMQISGALIPKNKYSLYFSSPVMIITLCLYGASFALSLGVV
ncbi:MAG: CPBP family intramembrane metalloprotease [Oscillospiraceae bacterium]|jgi:membrane protease YdiL (CAAX protease family)|nr:CPBP family intramembrane metalloprotease [Oscillospiraceae bacterium]